MSEQLHPRLSRVVRSLLPWRRKQGRRVEILAVQRIRLQPQASYTQPMDDPEDDDA